MYVYEKVRFYIEYYGIKQNAVAKKAGISNVTFNAILNGKRKLYADDLRAICIALNVPPEMFIDLRDTSPSEVPLETLAEEESDNQ
ncbi:MAG: helix-turn-helix transcriptional regulator [Oscillospiraceae bacterium]|nr:helix-turn-helix transcriptional regulator [Oscillospiraceae bacterium]